MSKVNWFVRPYREGDDPGVAALYENVYKRPLDIPWYLWKLHRRWGDAGTPNVWVVESDDGLVGHYSGIPYDFWFQGKQIAIRHASDAMTHTAYRRQGILSALGRIAHDTWSEAGESFLIGLPNYDNWGSRTAYLNYQYMFPIGWLRRPLRPDRGLAARLELPAQLFWPLAAASKAIQAVWNRSLKAADGVVVAPVDTPGEDFDDLWLSHRNDYHAVMVRDSAWVRYRYTEAPGGVYTLLLATRNGRPVGYLAYRMTTGDGSLGGWIVDLFTALEDWSARAALLKAALARLFQAGVGSVRFMLPPDTPLHAWLRRAGFSVSPGGFGCHVVPLAWTETSPVLSDPNSWFTVAGDYDIV